MLVAESPNSAAEMDPADMWAAAKLHRVTGEPDKAIPLLEALCARFPGQFRYALGLGELLLDRGELDRSGLLLQRARSIGTPDPKTLEVLEQLLLRHRLLTLEQAGKPLEVVGTYHQMVRSNPSLVRKIEKWTPIVNRAGQSYYARHDEHVGEMAEGIIQEVRARGIAIRHYDQIVGEPGLFEELKAVVGATTDWTVPGKPHFFKAIREEEASASHPIMKVGLHPKLLEIANGFYGLYTRLVSANIVQTRADASSERLRQGSEGWHRDPEDTPMFKIFIYLNDVLDVGSGPFQYISESRPGGRYEHLMPRFGRGVYDPTYKTKPDWEQTDREVEAEDVVTVLGRAGSMFFCDTSAFHRGGYCTTQDRYMAAYVYQRPGSQFPSYIKTDDVDASAPLAVRMAVAPV